MIRIANRQLLVVLLLTVVFTLPLLLGGGYLLTKYRWAGQALVDVEPRYARLLGLVGSRAELAQVRNSANLFVAKFAYPASLDVSQAGNDAQQRIRNITTSAGLSIASSQVLPPKSDTFFDRIPLSVRLEGELPALQAALVVLSNQSPAMHFESFTVNTYGAVKAETPQRLVIQLNMFVLRSKS